MCKVLQARGDPCRVPVLLFFNFLFIAARGFVVARGVRYVGCHGKCSADVCRANQPGRFRLGDNCSVVVHSFFDLSPHVIHHELNLNTTFDTIEKTILNTTCQPTFCESSSQQMVKLVLGLGDWNMPW